MFEKLVYLLTLVSVSGFRLTETQNWFLRFRNQNHYMTLSNIPRFHEFIGFGVIVFWLVMTFFMATFRKSVSSSFRARSFWIWSPWTGAWFPLVLSLRARAWSLSIWFFCNGSISNTAMPQASKPSKPYQSTPSREAKIFPQKHWRVIAWTSRFWGYDSLGGFRGLFQGLVSVGLFPLYNAIG